MPLRDHFRAPIDNLMSWEGFHGQWPAMIVLALARKLPPGYVAEPRIHLEIDVTSDYEDEFPSNAEGNGGTAVAFGEPGHSIHEYEVHIYETKRSRRLVAAIEIVCPVNKDRPEHRRAFVAKCATLLRNHVSVVIVDLVTTRNFNLYQDLLEFIGHPVLAEGERPSLYAVASRGTKKDDRTWVLEAWEHQLTLGQPLPTLPLWLTDQFAIPLDLEESYEETCRVFRLA